MGKKFWNYTYSLLLSIILLLLVGIFIYLDGGNQNKTKDFPIRAAVSPDATCFKEETDRENQESILYEIFSAKDEDLQLFHQFMEVREKSDTPKIAIIIDDLGYQQEIAERIMNLNFPVTISILPFLAHSRSIFEEAEKREISVLLHLPMEPHNANINPGEGAIFTSMNADEIKNKMEAVFREFPNIDGINNHMGSKVTEDEQVMRVVLNEIKKKNIFFIDSMTSPHSVGYELSKQMGIKTAYRSIFLDNEQDLDSIRQQVDQLKELALLKGEAIAIGHPYCNTVNVLIEAGLQLQAEGIKIVRLEELLH